MYQQELYSWSTVEPQAPNFFLLFCYRLYCWAARISWLGTFGHLTFILRPHAQHFQRVKSYRDAYARKISNGFLCCFAWLCWIFKFYIVLRCTKKLEKLQKLENFRAVRMEKSRPLERMQLANQIIGPLRCWRKKVKHLLPVCQILWHFTEGTAKKVTVRFFAFFVHIDVRKYRKMKPRVRWAFLSMVASSEHMQLLNFS